MNNFFIFIRHKMWPAAAIALLTVMTLSTSAMGISKLAGSFNSPKPKIQAIQTVEAKEKEMEKNAPSKVLGSEIITVSNPTSAPSPLPTHPAAQAKLTTNTSASVSTSGSTGSSCIVTLFGKQYDVSPLQTSHTGGNIFQCGTDMTNTYKAQHGTDLTRMQPYLLTSLNNSQTSTQSPTPSTSQITASPNPTGAESVREDDDDHSSRKIEYDDDAKHEEDD